MLDLGRKSVVWVLGGIAAAALIVAGIWRYGITAFAFVMHHYQVFISLGALATALGAGIAAYQLRRKNRLTSVSIVAQALKEFAVDNVMQDVFYDIEYGKFEYPGGSQGSTEERRIDRLLRHFAAIALARKNGLVNSGDLVLIQYYVVKIMDNDNVMKYVRKIRRNWAKDGRKIEHPYTVLKRFYEDLEESSYVPDSSGTKR